MKLAPALTLVSLAFASIAVAAATFKPPKVDSPEPPVVRDQRLVAPKSVPTSLEQQEQNKQIVLNFHYEMFELRRYKESVEKYLAPDLLDHESQGQTPRGRDAYLKNLWKDLQENEFLKDVQNNPAKRPRILSVSTQDDLVMMAFEMSVPWPNGPKPRFDYINCDLFRVTNGKISEIWWSGTPSPGQVAAPTPSAK